MGGWCCFPGGCHIYPHPPSTRVLATTEYCECNDDLIFLWSETFLVFLQQLSGLTKHSRGLKHRKGATENLLNTVNYDKGPDNPKPKPNPTPNLKSFVVLCYGMIPSSLSFFAVFSRSI